MVGQGTRVLTWHHYIKDITVLNSAVENLCSFSLLSKDPVTLDLSMHSLLHSYASTTLDVDNEQKRRLSQLLVEMVTASLRFGQEKEVKQWKYEMRISQHINRCCDILQSELATRRGPLHLKDRKALYLLAQAQSQMGEMNRAVALYELGLRDCADVQSASNLMTADMMNSYGMVLRLQARYDSSETHHMQAKEIIEGMPPSELTENAKQQKLLEIEQHLAAILVGRQAYRGAKDKLDKVLVKQQQQQTTSEISASALKTQLEIGRVLQLMGKLGDARAVFELVRKVSTAQNSDCHPTTFEAAHALATVLQELGEYDKSLKLLEETLEKQKESPGEGHYSTLDTMHSISNLYERRGQYDKALRMSEQVLTALEVVLPDSGGTHPWMLVVRSSVADIKLRQGEYESALKSYRDIFHGCTARGLKTDASRTQINIARTFRDMGEYDQALQDCEEALEGLGSGLDEDPEYVATAQFCKASILELQGRFREAQELYEHVVDQDKEQLGNTSLGTLKTKCFTYNVMAKRGEYSEALLGYDKIKHHLGKLGESDQLLLRLLVMHGKADIYEKLATDGTLSESDRLERNAKALNRFEKVIKMREDENLRDTDYYRAIYSKGRARIRAGEKKGLQDLIAAKEEWETIFKGEDHPLIFMALEDIGKEKLRQEGSGALGLARKLCSQALQGCENKLRPGHPQTCQVRLSLGAVLRQQADFEAAAEVYATSLRELEGELGKDHVRTQQVREILMDVEREVAAKRLAASGDDEQRDDEQKDDEQKEDEENDDEQKDGEQKEEGSISPGEEALVAIMTSTVVWLGMSWAS